jgi:hypothetical protein
MNHAESPEEDEDTAWIKLFRALSENYGWTPAQISDLTLPQLWYYLRPESEFSGGVPMGSEGQANLFHKIRREHGLET